MAVRSRHTAVIVLLAALLFGWTGGRGVLGDGDTTTAPALPAALCPVADECLPTVDGVRMHWISHTGNGDLFLLVRSDCRGNTHCGAWFVERTARGMTARLNIEGRFRVVNSGKAVPDVQSWRAVSENEFEVTRYTWSTGVFQRIETRTVYIVDGEECGSALDCYQKARHAHREQRTERALRILEKVHSISFI